MVSSIEFNLLAPYNKEVELVGSFLDDKPIAMEQGEDGHFRAQLELADGSYDYKFRVRSKSFFLEPDEWIEVIDPKATQVDEVRQVGVLTVKDGDRIVDDYVWQHDDQNLPQNEALVIYEIHVGDFSGGEADAKARGQFKHVVEKLDYLTDLGINAIELMPVQAFPGEQSWGYNTRHYFAVESSYGSTRDLKHLVDECHKRGIRVILDITLNHSDTEAPLTKIDYEYWYRREPKDPDHSWGPEFDYDHYDENLELMPARQFVKDIVQFWISEYHIDGFRFDAISQIGHFDFLNQLTAEAAKQAQPKPFYNIGELIPESPDATNVDGPLDACWRDAFRQQIGSLLCSDDGDLDTIKELVDARRSGYLDSLNVINYLSNHDHDHLMKQFSEHDIFGQTAFKRSSLGATILMTAVGIPLIWMGDEFGCYKEKSLDPTKINWTILKNDLNQDLFSDYQGLIRLRQENYALRTANVEFFHENPDDKVIGYIRWNDEGSRVVVVANFSDHYLANYEVSGFPHDGSWHEWLNDYDVQVENGALVIDLPGYEAKILV